MSGPEAWEVVDENSCCGQPPNTVQARAFLSKESNDWAKAYFKDAGVIVAHGLGELLEKAIADLRKSKKEAQRQKLLEVFGPDYKTLLKELIE